MKEYYKRENLEIIVKESYSLAEVLRKIGLRDMGSNFKTLRKYIKLYDIDTSHFRGQTWNKGLYWTDYTSYNKLDDILKDNVNFRATTLKNRLVKEGLKEYKCEKCGNKGEWMGEKFTLELHHINGNHFDNRLENLQILCPNCHSQTKTFRNKSERNKDVPTKQRKSYKYKCEYCGKEFYGYKKPRRFCCVEHYRNFLRNIWTDESI